MKWTLVVMAFLAVMLSACQPMVVEVEKVVKETVIVAREVEKVISLEEMAEAVAQATADALQAEETLVAQAKAVIQTAEAKTPTVAPTNTPMATSTNTSVPPTATPTNTSVPPTATPKRVTVKVIGDISANEAGQLVIETSEGRVSMSQKGELVIYTNDSSVKIIGDAQRKLWDKYQLWSRDGQDWLGGDRAEVVDGVAVFNFRRPPREEISVPTPRPTPPW